MGKYEISHEFMQEVTNYLVSRPYKEVYKILDGIRNLRMVEEPVLKQLVDAPASKPTTDPTEAPGEGNA